jgi:hypothetical protein
MRQPPVARALRAGADPVEDPAEVGEWEGPAGRVVRAALHARRPEAKALHSSSE